MCNCGKRKTLNNLNIPSYVQLARDFTSTISGTPVEQLEDHQWAEAYHIYGQIFPNSKGQPGKEELIKILNNAATYKTKR